MNRNWSIVFVAGLIEICWVIGLKHSSNTLMWIGTAVAIIISMYMLIYSTKTLPVGTAYAVFTGIGTSGTVVAEMIIFGEPVSILKILLILLLITGVVGLKMVTTKDITN